MQSRHSVQRAALFAALLTTSSIGNSAEVTGILGVDYSQGEYGTNTTTRQWSAPIGVKYDSVIGYAKISTAWVSVSNVNPNAMGEALPCGNSQTTSRDVQGLADTTLSLMKHIHDSGSFQLDAGTKIKFATGDANKCLSTGKNDFSLQTEAYKQLNSYGLFGTLGWTFKGKPEMGGQTIEYKNPFYLSAGITRQLDSQNSGGLAFDYRDALLDGRSSLQEFTVFGVHRVNPKLRFQPYLVKGFTSASPSISAGLNLLHTF